MCWTSTMWDTICVSVARSTASPQYSNTLYSPSLQQCLGLSALSGTRETAPKVAWSSAEVSHHQHTQWSASATCLAGTGSQWSPTRWGEIEPSTGWPSKRDKTYVYMSLTSHKYTFNQCNLAQTLIQMLDFALAHVYLVSVHIAIYSM